MGAGQQPDQKTEENLFTETMLIRRSRLLLIDIGIKIVGTILGVFFWPPFASIGVLIEAVFIAIMRRGNPEVVRD